jgi:hypothetical protein
MHLVGSSDKHKSIEDCVDSGTTVARKRYEYTETVIQLKQQDMRNAEEVRLTPRKPGKRVEEMANAIRDSLNNVQSSNKLDDGEYKDNNEDDTELGMLSSDAKHSWVMGTHCIMVQYQMESFRLKRMRLD